MATARNRGPNLETLTELERPPGSSSFLPLNFWLSSSLWFTNSRWNQSFSIASLTASSPQTHTFSEFACSSRLCLTSRRVPIHIWLPRCAKDLRTLSSARRLSPPGSHNAVLEISSGVIFKFGEDLSEEAVRRHLDIPVPNLIHHPTLHRRYAERARDQLTNPTSVWYICMERCPGQPLQDVIDKMFTPPRHLT